MRQCARIIERRPRRGRGGGRLPSLRSGRNALMPSRLARRARSVCSPSPAARLTPPKPPEAGGLMRQSDRRAGESRPPRCDDGAGGTVGPPDGLGDSRAVLVRLCARPPCSLMCARRARRRRFLHPNVKGASDPGDAAADVLHTRARWAAVRVPKRELRRSSRPAFQHSRASCELRSWETADRPGEAGIFAPRARCGVLR